MFAKATRIKLRVFTSKGWLAVEDLWDLSLQNLNTIAKNLKRELKNQAEVEDYLADAPEEDALTKLKFDIVLRILETKKAELNEAAALSEKKLKNQIILGKIAAKQEKELDNLSVEELKAMLLK